MKNDWDNEQIALKFIVLAIKRFFLLKGAKRCIVLIWDGGGGHGPNASPGSTTVSILILLT